MKYFIEEIKHEWKSVYLYRPGLWLVKYPIRSMITLVNRELAQFARSAVWNPTFLLTVILIALIAMYTLKFASTSALDQALDVIMGFLIALLTLFFTAAIFMATLSWSAASRAATANAEFHATLRKVSDDFLKRCYQQLSVSLSVDEKWVLVNAVAAESILDQDDYRKFRAWLGSIKKDFAETYYAEMATSPLNTATSNLEYRHAPILQAVSIIQAKLRDAESGTSQKVSPNADQTLQELEIAASRYEQSGAVSYYSQQDLLGINLSRVVTYGLLAIFLIVIYKLIGDGAHNFIPFFDLRSTALLKSLVVISALTALAIAIRYLLRFVSYFRWSVPEYRSPVYIYADDSSEEGAANFHGK